MVERLPYKQDVAGSSPSLPILSGCGWSIEKAKVRDALPMNALPVHTSLLHAVALRLKPQQDLKAELDGYVQQQDLEAACILTCVGSLTQVSLRYANQLSAAGYSGYFEIVSLTGVMSKYGSHYHMVIADSRGQTMGGHLLKGCLIYTTAEIVVGVLPQLSFCRESDETTGFQELSIQLPQMDAQR